MPAKKLGGGKNSFWAMMQIIYLYLVSFVALVILVINVGRVVHLGLQEWVFPIDKGVENSWEIDQCEEGNFKGVTEEGEQVVKPTQEEIDICIERAEERIVRREENNRNRTLASSAAFVLVTLPIWLLHYRRARKMK